MIILGIEQPMTLNKPIFSKDYLLQNQIFKDPTQESYNFLKNTNKILIILISSILGSIISLWFKNYEVKIWYKRFWNNHHIKNIRPSDILFTFCISVFLTHTFLILILIINISLMDRLISSQDIKTSGIIRFSFFITVMSIILTIILNLAKIRNIDIPSYQLKYCIITFIINMIILSFLTVWSLRLQSVATDINIRASKKTRLSFFTIVILIFLIITLTLSNYMNETGVYNLFEYFLIALILCSMIFIAINIFLINTPDSQTNQDIEDNLNNEISFNEILSNLEQKTHIHLENIIEDSINIQKQYIEEGPLSLKERINNVYNDFVEINQLVYIEKINDIYVQPMLESYINLRDQAINKYTNRIIDIINQLREPVGNNSQIYDSLIENSNNIDNTLNIYSVGELSSYMDYTFDRVKSYEVEIDLIKKKHQVIENMIQSNFHNYTKLNIQEIFSGNDQDKNLAHGYEMKPLHSITNEASILNHFLRLKTHDNKIENRLDDLKKIEIIPRKGICNINFPKNHIFIINDVNFSVVGEQYQTNIEDHIKAKNLIITFKGVTNNKKLIITVCHHYKQENYAIVSRFQEEKISVTPSSTEITPLLENIISAQSAKKVYFFKPREEDGYYNKIYVDQIDMNSVYTPGIDIFSFNFIDNKSQFFGRVRDTHQLHQGIRQITNGHEDLYTREISSCYLPHMPDIITHFSPMNTPINDTQFYISRSNMIDQEDSIKTSHVIRFGQENNDLITWNVEHFANNEFKITIYANDHEITYYSENKSHRIRVVDSSYYVRYDGFL